MDTDDIWKRAIQEAYANAPSGTVLLDTIELNHPSFTAPVRLVNDVGNPNTIDGEEFFGFWMRTENNQRVFFQSCGFDFTLPAQNQNDMPSVDISFDNVSQMIMEYLDEAVKFKAPMTLIYREYLASDKEEPQFVLSGLSMASVSSNLFRVSGTATFSDLVNKSFPKKVYRPTEFPGLRR